jgi:hypothetical protein
MRDRLRTMLALSLTAFPLMAQSSANTVIVTPGTQAALGWGPATGTRQPFGAGTQAITTTSPQSGDGSIELRLPAGNTRTGYGFGDFVRAPNGTVADICAATPTCSRLGLLSDAGVLSFQYRSPLSGGSVPVFRLYFTLTNPQNALPRFGSFIWTLDANFGVNSGNWTTVNLLNERVAFRPIFGGGGTPNTGQISADCVNSDRSGSISDRSVTINAWLTACDGNNGRLDLSGAQVLGWDVGQGLDANPDDRVAFVDNITVGFGTTSTTWNFESNAAVVPEPSTYALMATGLIGLGGIVRRRNRGAAARD